MKILALHFKNINSLEGESRIDFTLPPISDTGVFAITGANGSGKSSILDAITLGLYGETFRFDRPASFVMTKHTAECFAEVDFALSGDRYQSSWHVRRTDENPLAELEQPQMRLVRLQDGVALASNPHQVCALITELTGMNFRNFTRSILLAQGDFAAFLNALDSERMDILEKIINTDIYADSKKQITDKADEAQQKLADLTTQLAGISLLEPEQLDAHQQDLHDFNEQHAEFQARQKKLQQQQVALNGIAELQQQFAHQQNQVASVNAQFENLQGQLEQIVAMHKALQFKDDALEVNDKKQAIAQHKAALDNFQRELEQLKDRLGGASAPEQLAGQSLPVQKQTIDGLAAKVNSLRTGQQSEMQLWQALGTQINDKKAGIDRVAGWLAEHAADEILLDNFPETGKLKRFRAERIELSEKQKVFAKKTKKSTVSFKNNNAALEQANKNVVEFGQQLDAAEKELEALADNHTLDEIEALRQEQQERVEAFQELHDLALAHNKLTDGGFSLFAAFKRKSVRVMPETQRLAAELERLTQEIKREENIKQALDRSLIYEALLKKMAPERVHLVDGKPCPLCGSLQHPFSKHPPVVMTNSVKAVSDQQLKIRTLQISATQLRQQITASQKAAENEQGSQLRAQQLKTQWLSLCNRLNVASPELGINNTKLMQHLVKNEAEQLKEIVALLSKYQSQQALIVKTKALIAENQADALQLQASAGQLGAVYEEQTQEYKANADALALCVQEEKQLIEKITAQLATLGEKMPDKGKEDALFDRLNSRRQEYQGYALRRKSLADELATLQTKQVDCQAEITRYNELLELYGDQLQGAEAVGLHLALIEKQKLIADKQQLLAQLKNELALLLQTLQEKIQASGFISVDELQQQLDMIASQPELERQKAQLEQTIVEKTSLLDNIKRLLDAGLDRIGTVPDIEQLEQQLKTVAEKKAIVHFEIERLEKVLKQQRQQQQRYDSVQAQLQQQQTLTEACLVEVTLLGAEHGMAFRRRVQTKLAGQLLVHANAMLEKLSGRYYVRQRPSEQGLALEIEDTYQNNVRRFPKTLSGGEGFVVSLALALGLSEMASNGRSVDSLFLDEGFGNLDAETLYTVISTLESLQTHGKTVGVISHVEAVQKRFKAQLQVVKKPNGMGELRQVS